MVRHTCTSFAVLAEADAIITHGHAEYRRPPSPDRGFVKSRAHDQFSPGADSEPRRTSPRLMVRLPSKLRGRFEATKGPVVRCGTLVLGRLLDGIFTYSAGRRRESELNPGKDQTGNRCTLVFALGKDEKQTKRMHDAMRPRQGPSVRHRVEDGVKKHRGLTAASSLRVSRHVTLRKAPSSSSATQQSKSRTRRTSRAAGAYLRTQCIRWVPVRVLSGVWPRSRDPVRTLT